MGGFRGRRALIISRAIGYAAAMAEPEPAIYGALEAGGTKFVCAIGTAQGVLLEEARLPTRDPDSTLRATCEFFRAAGARHGAPRALGVASFGPVHLDPAHPFYGHIARTPKPGWSHADMAGTLAREFGCPVGFDTDVNAAALAEHRWGAARDVQDLVYVTVGTGIGGGVIAGGKPVHGLLHPEIGHILPRRHPADTLPGVCPFHGDCLEGLAAGPAIVARCGAELAALADDHVQWQIEAEYLAQLCATLVLTLSPRRIVLGGGVMGHERLFAPLRARLLGALGGYIDRPEITEHIERYVVAPGLGTRSGVLGALSLAIAAASV
jgi:fructokinase